MHISSSQIWRCGVTYNTFLWGYLYYFLACEGNRKELTEKCPSQNLILYFQIKKKNNPPPQQTNKKLQEVLEVKNILGIASQ